MSSIGGIGGLGIESEQMNPWAKGVERGRSQFGIGQMPQGSDAPQDRMMERIESLAREAGLDSDAIASLNEDLQSAISTAIANATETNASDPRQALHSAVQSTLEKYGIDSQQLAPGQGAGQGNPMRGRIESLAREAGLDSETTTSLLQELDSAISTAFANAKESGESRDPHEAVQTAVRSVLEKYGIDADQLAPPSGPPEFGSTGKQGSGDEGLATILGSQYGVSSGQGVVSSLLDLLQVVDEKA